MKRWPLLSLIVAGVCAQMPPLEYSGKPITVPFGCTEAELQPLGLTCVEEEPCTLYLDLSAVDAIGTRVFLAGNLHSLSATIQSILLLSEDAGKTWREPYERLRGASFEALQFFDLENGWISGHVLQTFPRDPFLLITGDGGKTWRRRAVNEEGRLGSIDQFWFESKNSGTMIIDRSRGGEPGVRSELYETQTGGDTWTLREVSSKMIAPKRPRIAPVSDYRLRADAKLKAYRVEKRDGARWNTLASFLIQLPDCKVVPPPVVEPPPPEPEPAAVKPAAPKTPPTLKKKTP